MVDDYYFCPYCSEGNKKKQDIDLAVTCQTHKRNAGLLVKALIASGDMHLCGLAAGFAGLSL